MPAVETVGEMFYARLLMGNSDSSFYAMIQKAVPVLAGRALLLIEDSDTR